MPNPVADTPPIFVVSLPYSVIAISLPLLVMLSSTASNSSFEEISGLILTRTFKLECVAAIDTIVVVTPDSTSTLSVLTVTTPPKLVLPVPKTSSSMSYDMVITL